MSAAPLPESKVDVLIIGAGPAGLMCANALAHAGVHVRIIDKRATRVEIGQADGILPRTIEVFQSYGLYERLLREGSPIHRIVFYNPGPDGLIKRTQSSTALLAPTARYPFATTRHQGGIEAIFEDSIRTKGVSVQRSTVPVAIELSQDESELEDPNAYPVKATLKRLDPNVIENEVVHAKFVLGADGAHSWVRREMNIRMEGDQTDSIWGVVDILPETDFPEVRQWAIIHSNHGTLMNIPREDDLTRFYIQLSEDSSYVDPATGRLDKDRANPETFIETAAKIIQPYSVSKIGDVRWWTVYTIGQRYAQSFSVKDRIFIAGDACHTHSPKAGQGMNASMADSHNLAWKLAYVLRGWAGMSLLQTYEFERLKFAQDLINFDRKWSKFFSGKPWSEDNQEGVTQEEFMAAFRTSSGFISGIGIHYEPSVITDNKHQSCASKLIVGERMIPRDFVRAGDISPVNIHDMLPADTRFKILVFVGNVAIETTKDLLRSLAERLDAPEGFLRRFGHGDYSKVFDILCICATSKDDMSYIDVPKIFRSHWTKVLLDDIDMQGQSGGGGFDAYGIDADTGAIVIVRPDGYVGTVAPLDGLEYVSGYFSSFMLERRTRAREA